MEGVTATFSNYVDLAARCAAVFRREHPGLYLEFSDCIHGRLITQAAVIRIDINGAIQQEGSVVSAAAGYAQSADQTLAELVLLHGAAAGVGAGDQQSELQELAAVQWQRYDFVFLDYGTLRGSIRVQQGSRSGNLDHFQ